MLKITFIAAALALGPALVMAQDIDGDPAVGEKVFRKCKACHTVGDSAENKAGPMLNGIVGRPVASVDGFGYSAALQALNEEGVVWTPDALAAFLEKPKGYVKGTKMAFPGLRKEDERLGMIAYLSTFPGGDM
ncbi:MAG: cytochrome c family protein [Pseudomonadota bacterium]